MKKFVLFAVLALILAGCVGPTGLTDNSPETTPEYDLLEDDVMDAFADNETTSSEVGIKGVMLNDTKRDVTEAFGAPDNFTMFEGDGLVIENLEYGKSLGLNQTGLIFHIRNDRVERITLNDKLNGELEGDTVLNESKEEFFFELGSSDETELLYKYVVYKYNDLGLQIITFRGEEVAISIVNPSETNRNISTEIEPYYIPYSDQIEFT